MSVKEPTEQLRKEMASIKKVADGKMTTRLRVELALTALKLAKESWARGESPYGKTWKSGKGGVAGGLHKSGRMESALRMEPTERGFALVNKAKTDAGAFYAGSHQYGRTIRPKGVERVWKKATRVTDKEIAKGYSIDASTGQVMRVRRGKLVRVGTGYKKLVGAKPLKWRTPDGKWHSSWKVRIPARPMLPKGAQLPRGWADAFEAVAKGVVEKGMGK